MCFLFFCLFSLPPLCFVHSSFSLSSAAVFFGDLIRIFPPISLSLPLSLTQAFCSWTHQRSKCSKFCGITKSLSKSSSRTPPKSKYTFSLSFKQILLLSFTLLLFLSLLFFSLSLSVSDSLSLNLYRFLDLDISTLWSNLDWYFLVRIWREEYNHLWLKRKVAYSQTHSQARIETLTLTHSLAHTYTYTQSHAVRTHTLSHKLTSTFTHALLLCEVTPTLEDIGIRVVVQARCVCMGVYGCVWVCVCRCVGV